MTKKIIERFIPCLVTGVEGCIKERPLQPQKTLKEAEELAQRELIKCKPGCMAHIDRVFVCAIEEEAKSPLILPQNFGKMKVIE
jgi:hypothetical protein